MSRSKNEMQDSITHRFEALDYDANDLASSVFQKFNTYYGGRTHDDVGDYIASVIVGLVEYLETLTKRRDT